MPYRSIGSVLLAACVMVATPLMLIQCRLNDDSSIDPPIIAPTITCTTSATAVRRGEDPATIVDPETVAGCIDRTSTTSCTFETLPLIGHSVDIPTISYLETRTIASHPWMCDRFSQALAAMSPELQADMMLLFRGISGVVIADDIRPAYYRPSTDAIYLDPDYLWLLNEEKQIIDPTPDYRTDYGNELLFATPWRYVTGTERTYPSWSLTDDSERTIEEVLPLLSRLLFHELAHANDYFPPSLVLDDDFDRRQTPIEALSQLSEERISEILRADSPLESEEMHSYARIRYLGGDSNTVKPNIRTHTHNEMGGFFDSDRASHSYSYTTPREDLAMLFENVMMKKHFNSDADIAFTTNPSDNPDPMCDDYIVGWGIRGRIGHPQVINRARFVTENILPEWDADDFFSSLPMPSSMAPGCGWCDNYDLSCDTTPPTDRVYNIPGLPQGPPMPAEDIRPPHAPQNSVDAP